eukprot:GHVU01224922.1.p2 GENE.GHVU01224922.1~~GHVU01224922.1.p2  ORF type:complete len:159 (-),score=19.39 GHVU01224922.1:1621-2097(-)
MIGSILEEDTMQDGIYSLMPRWARERRHGWTSEPAEDGGARRHQCYLRLHEWFNGPVNYDDGMEEEDEEYLLENGSLWQEIYVCCRACLGTPMNRNWDYRAYWARAVFCLYLTQLHGDRSAARLLNEFLHRGVDYRIMSLERRISAFTTQYIQIFGYA